MFLIFIFRCNDEEFFPSCDYPGINPAFFGELISSDQFVSKLFKNFI